MKLRQGIQTMKARKWSKRSLGLGLLAIAYLQVAVGFIATGGSSGLLKYGYAWVRELGIPWDQTVGVLFILGAVTMITCAIARRWKESLAGLGYGAAAIPISIHMFTCLFGMMLGDLNLLEYQSALGSQVGLIFILAVMHNWQDPLPTPPAPPSREEPPK